MPDRILIKDLAVWVRIGVPEEERAEPQRLLISLELEHEFSRAIADDELSATINYDAVCKRLLGFGQGKSWKLVERLADEIAHAVLAEFRPKSVRVRIKKFIIPEAQYVGVEVVRERGKE